MDITASLLYDFTQCPHKVWRDVYGPQEEKIVETNPFVQLLWDRGVQFEKEVIKDIGEHLDLSEGRFDERDGKTVQAMKDGFPLIYQGVIRRGNLVGIPDLLRKQSDGNYIPIEIKAGKGYEGSDDENVGKPKKHYAIQLALYIEILKNLGFTQENRGVIFDINRNEVIYLLEDKISLRNPMTWWQYYEGVKNEVDSLINNRSQNLPAKSSKCKLCAWYNSCIKWCEQSDDLTNIFYLGRNVRDKIVSDLEVSTTNQLNELDISGISQRKKKDKSFLRGVGEKSLQKYINRADIINNKKEPVIYSSIDFPKVSVELFFDIETDPTQDLTYLHGIYERSGEVERFIHFLANSNDPSAEKRAWGKFWDYVNGLPKDDFAIYYYSHYEYSTYKSMSRKYSDVISEEDVVSFFDKQNAIDLYKIVQSQTDWPLSSYSLKDIATYLGFKWRDETPSGALSIQWYNEYLRTQDEDILSRIIEYNEDDCKATMVLKDKLVELSCG